MLLTIALIQTPKKLADTLVTAARAQIGVTKTYNPEYVKLNYPGGDIPISKGVCTDVVIRAFRAAKLDLQKLIHEDWIKNPKAYGGKRSDSNIDHRRVPNQMTYFARRGKSVTGTIKPGDIIAWRLSNGLLHTGIATSATTIVHNIGYGAQEEVATAIWKTIGHYRW
jgi:uncharacterized protein